MTTTPAQGVPEPAPARGASIGRFLVLGPLGSGGMGVVISAYDPQLDRRVALKLLRGDIWRGDRAAAGRESLLGEAQAMARLNHPNVVAVYEVALTDDGGYVVMEQVEGRTLRAWLDEEERDWREIVGIVVQAGAGLAAAHRAGVVHRDFKPDNVLVGEDGRPRVSDFGLALAGETTPGAGTRAYMAPEQAAGAHSDARADQYSFCVTLWEALHGKRPQELSAAPRDRWVPGWLRRVLERGLSERPDDRYPSMKALLHDLQRDPGRTARRAIVMGGGAGALAVAGFLVASLRGPTCETSLAGVWDAPARTKLQAAFAATGSSQAEAAFAHVVAPLDTWAAAWTNQSDAACRARAEPLADRRAMCLEDLKIQLRATVGVLTQKVTADTFDSAISAVAALGDVGACGDPQALAGSEPPPSDPMLRARAAAMLLRLEELRTLDDFPGGDTVAEFDQLLPVIRAFPTAHVRLRGLTYYGAALQNQGDMDEARRVLQEVISEAAAAHDDRESARAWVELVDVVAWQKRWDDVLALSFAAEAAVRRVDVSPRSIGWIYFAKARAHKEKGDRTLAELETRLSIAFIESAPGHVAYQHHKVVGLLANLVFERGDTAAAIELTRRRIRDLSAAHGPDHFGVGTARTYLAELLLRRGDLVDAEASARTGVESVGTQLNKRNHGYVHSLSVWAEALERLGRIEDARARLDEALQVADVPTKGIGPRMLLPGLLDRYGHFLLRRGDLAGAREKIARGRALREETFGADSPAVGESILSEADLLLTEKKPAAALQRYQDGAARFTAKDARLVRALSGQAEALLALARPAEALAVLERAKAVGVADPRCEALYAQALRR